MVIPTCGPSTAPLSIGRGDAGMPMTGELIDRNLVRLKIPGTVAMNPFVDHHFPMKIAMLVVYRFRFRTQPNGIVFLE